MNTDKKKLKEFVLKTLLPYKEDPSKCASVTTTEYGINSDRCMYLTEDGRKCAVGVWMNEGEWQKSFKSARELLNEYPQDKVLKKEALEMNLTLSEWQLLQSYHDTLAHHPRHINNRVKIIENILEIKLPELKV